MKLRKAMVIALSISGLLVLILMVGRINLSIRFHAEVKELFAQSKNVSSKTFSHEQLLGLPEPVQRYFKHVLKVGQPYISQVRLKHNGQFKTDLDKEWISIEGEQYFAVDKPGYIWKGTTPIFTARDMYLAEEGRLIVTLLSLINIVNGKGENFDEGELQRWLAEGVWFPTNLLPSEKLKWSKIDSTTAKLQFNYKYLSFFYIVTFNENDEITLMETQRYMGEGKRATWIGKLEGYEERSGIRIPTKIEAI